MKLKNLRPRLKLVCVCRLSRVEIMETTLETLCPALTSCWKGFTEVGFVYEFLREIHAVCLPAICKCEYDYSSVITLVKYFSSHCICLPEILTFTDTSTCAFACLSWWCLSLFVLLSPLTWISPVLSPGIFVLALFTISAFNQLFWNGKMTNLTDYGIKLNTATKLKYKNENNFMA